MYESMCSIIDGIPGRRILPVSSQSNGALVADMSEDRRLPPLPCVEPLPRGPLDPFSANAYASGASRSQYTCPGRSTRPAVERRVVAISSSARSEECSLQSDQFQMVSMWPQELSCPQILNLIAPTNINRKPPLQQPCGRKRKASTAPAGLGNQRERHRIAEGNRRKNLSQLHRELDRRIHDFFLEQAGWNPSKGLPESKEHIVQAAIFLIDYMAWIIKYLLRQENNMPRQLLEYLAPPLHIAAAAGVQSSGAEPDFPAAVQETSGKPDVDGA
ncbi:HLH DNA binding domain protein [Aspergillus niger]|nr:HLH DNA binding domain protein [Aspergillus niger]